MDVQVHRMITEDYQKLFSNAEHLPFLYRKNPEQPVLVPFLYVVLRLRHKAYNTTQSQLRAI